MDASCTGRRRPLGGGARRATILLASILAVAGCASGEPSRTPATTSTATGPTTPAPAATPSIGTLATPIACEQRPDLACATVDGLQVMLPTGAIRDGRPALLIDPGGPGLDGRNAVDGLLDDLPMLRDSHSIVVPLEPWTTASLDADCQGALDSFIGAVRTGGDVSGASTGFTASCGGALDDEAAHDGQAYVGLAEQLLLSGSSRVDAIAVSFGAIRIGTALAAGAPIDRVLELSPATAARDLETYVTARADRAVDRLAEAGVALDPILAPLDAPIAVEGRSVPLTQQDIVAAVVAASYSPKLAAPWLIEAAADTERAAATLADHADGLLLRYGVDSHYRALVGYYGAACAGMLTEPGGATPEPSSSARDAIRSFLQQLHTPCGELDARWIGSDVNDVPTCTIHGALDAVVDTRDADILVTNFGHTDYTSEQQVRDATTAFLTDPDARECTG